MTEWRTMADPEWPPVGEMVGILILLLVPILCVGGLIWLLLWTVSQLLGATS